jgi:hypothetical protein
MAPIALVAMTAMVGGCGAQSILLGTEGDYLLTVMDSLALPGEPVELRARLQGGDFLQAQTAQVIRFSRNGDLFKAAETDDNGYAVVTFSPSQAGEYSFTAEVAAAGLEKDPPRPQELHVTCQAADTPMIVVDLDKTVVASGFHMVLLGDPNPMAGSADLLRRLRKEYTIVYLTHRPDYFGIKSKNWLWEHDYPKGPVLLSTAGEFFSGSGSYKGGKISELQKRFKKIEIGIGDKISDAEAYHQNGLKSFLIVQIPDDDKPKPYLALAEELKELSDEVQVVTGWDQIEKALFQNASYPRAAMEQTLRKMGQVREKRNDDDDDDDDD